VTEKYKILILFRKKNTQLFIRYLIIGVIVYLIDMFFFLFSFYFLELNVMVSNIAAKLLAGFAGFFLHRGITFNVDRTNYNATQKFKYLLLMLFTNIGSIILFYFALFFLQYEILAKFITDVVVIVLSYALSKFWIFAISDQDRV